MSIFVNILLFLLVISILTFVHELGHFISAKIIGAKVLEFSLGFGPKLFSKKWGETLYSFRGLPFGGYVKILGDGDPGEEMNSKADDKRDLRKKPKWQQIFVMLSGVTMNILLAISIYYVVLASNGWELVLNSDFKDFKAIGAEVYLEREGDVEYEIIEGGKASEAKLPEKGFIKSIDNKEIVYMEEVGEYISTKKGETISINICVDEKCSDYVIEVPEEGKIGISLPSNYLVILSYKEHKLFAGFSHIRNSLVLIGKKLGEMIGNARLSGDYSELSNSVSGPVGIYFVIDYFKKFGAIPFLGMIADLSVSLALVNVLPIPALDGGRVLILLLEWIAGKELDEKIETKIINGSFIFLIILILFIIIKDIVNIDSMKELFK
ncbi:MAG TPA: M50 family metallopeptidase [Candidatus Dojkabacteria bacterium]|nr:M50 family metallopeptidase [Candidatus Dojkabacteria bacterium]